jgi:acetyl esterase/lipase
MSFRTRQLVTAALNANAVKAFPSYYGSVPAMFGGWLTSELAPHLAVATAADTLRQLAKKDRDWIGIGLGAANTAALSALVVDAQRTEQRVEDAIVEALGPDYRDLLTDELADREPATTLKRLAWPFDMSHSDVEVLQNIPYSEAGSRGLLDIYRPKGGVSGAPVLLQVHGGGWAIGNKDQQGLQIMNRLASLGWVCVAINYRLSPRAKWPAHIVDVKRSIAWIRENIEMYGGDPEFVAITGGSAGGHLSALAALTPNDPEFQPGFEDIDTTIAAAVPFYGVYDMAGESSRKAQMMRDSFLAKTVFGVDPQDDLEVFRRASPLQRVTPEAPPFFVIHGEQDVLAPVGQARQLVASLHEESKAPVAYLELPRTQHAFEVFTSIRSAHVIRGAERFLRAVHADAVAR